MRKLVEGIVEFRRSRRPDYAETFARLALRQKPDALYIACSDSRVQANVFASTEPGDLFVVRNPGNLVSPAGPDGKSISDESEAAAIEFALDVLEVRDIIVCGHSGCGAMAALASGRENVRWPHLRSWLRHADAAAERLGRGEGDPERTPEDRLSQLNVLLQLDHLRSYEPVRRRGPGLHSWWFEIATAEVHAWDPVAGRFRAIDDEHAGQILQRMKR
ncbi:MAG: carbonic anhydrase [Myxococcales bacterium]